MSEITNIVLSGVGGQGSVSASRVIARAVVLSGLQVSTSEVHGMAQRGGSVFSTVRFGTEVYSPVIPEGEAQYLLGFELLEAVRYLSFLEPGGVAVVSDQRIMPTIEALRLAPYPADVESLIRNRAGRAIFVPGLQMASQLGNPKLANSVLLGALSAFLEIGGDAWRQALSELTPPNTVELNLRAFEDGVSYAREHTQAS